MARPVKEGLDYFPLYVDIFEDEKIEAISGEFGIKGEIIVVKLLCAIYKKGYFILWSDLIIAQMLKRLPGISKDLLNNVVERLVLWEFFDKDLFHSAGILTSEKIQENFFEATKRRKSPKPTLYVLDKFLENDNSIKNDVNGVNVDINTQTKGVNVDINTQSKVKESKVKDSVSNNTISLLNKMLKIKVDSKFLTKINSNINVNKLIEELSKSKWVCDNFDLNTASNSFLVKLCDGKFRDFKPVNTNKFKNFKQITDSYSAEDLEEMAMQKQKAGFEKLGVDI
ncbi:DUF4373 domain-containing protein [Peptoniphilus gorbachii]|uniref:Lin1244/Lin1753-like N-terminal domain-containing protein n=1 Tax=Peptoniphilus gorbachii TaxID=411567 RepID=A0ABS2MKJ4_9FIRM|nr:DUF4373 domain-containing protein [Peptoniphilus gorbachii]MBM7550538.1 hypothetical protein [Peptoniphilus gorbachii]MDU1582556.1 DUF4373 domain-containing protein [Peptoniphilus harei]MDU1663743.1 DUF4373 domain-containing protein [Peptoniphilus harei]